jgi:hypothetical protein
MRTIAFFSYARRDDEASHEVVNLDVFIERDLTKCLIDRLGQMET